MTHVSDASAVDTSARTRLDGAVAVVTGGGAGIGEAVCHRLALEGATLVVADVDEAAAQLTLGVSGGLGGSAVMVDVADPGQVDALAASVLDEYGAIDIWVNNAGVMATGAFTDAVRRRSARRTADGDVEWDALVSVDDHEWRRMMAVNFDGVFHGCRAAARAMVPRKAGSIINVASICGLNGCELSPHYSAAKAGVIGLTRAAGKELIASGVRMNAIAPGFVDTQMVRSAGDGFVTAIQRSSPIGRLGTPQEIAAAVAFLAGPDSTFFAGQVLSPNGGVVTG